MEIYDFVDVSERAYADVVYLRCVSGDVTRISLILMKIKVVPLI